METFVFEQEERKGLIETAARNFKKDSDSRKTRKYLEIRIRELERVWHEFRECHQSILRICDKKREHPYFKNEFYGKVQEIYFDLSTTMEERLEGYKVVERGQQSVCNSVVQTMPDCLPKIELPIFNGEYESWVSFRDLFVSVIHESQMISNVQKIHHLKTHVSGEAEQLIRHLSITSDNYLIAWNCLKNRYENKRVLVNSCLNKLLLHKVLTHESAKELRNVVDQTNQALKGLQNLGVDISTWDPILIHMLTAKLPKETHKAWEHKLGNSTDLPKLADFMDCLESRFRTLEAIDMYTQAPATNRRSHQSTSYFIRQESQCGLCRGQHAIRSCRDFNEQNAKERHRTIMRMGLCTNCLNGGHWAKQCPSKNNCRTCGKRHHTALHQDQGQADETKASSGVIKASSKGSTTNLKTFFSHKDTSERVPSTVLATALVTIQATTGHHSTFRALLDQGSQASFISETAVQALRLKKERVRSTISGLGTSTAGISNARVRFTMQDRNQRQEYEVMAYVLKALTSLMPSRKLDRRQWEHLQNIPLADPTYDRPGSIDILLGADVCAQIIRGNIRRGKAGTPIAQQTSLGWVIYGETSSGREYQQPKVTNLHLQIELDKQLRRFWEVEELLDNTSPRTAEERECEQIYTATTERDTTGRYVVRLPFRSEEHLRLGKSRNIAIKRLMQMEKRLSGDQELRDEYNKCIDEYVKVGHMVPVNTIETDHIRELPNGERYYTCAYLPHHYVLKESSTTTKLRVVFDASRETTSGTSLNDILLKGPTLQDDIISILIRWRKHRIALSADITKMYRQVKVQDKDSDYQRIVWRKNQSETIQDYALKTVTFGTTCAPFLAIRTLQQVAEDEGGKMPEGAKTIKTDFYVDDLLSGHHNVEGAIKRYREITAILQKGGFTITKWTSNSAIVLNQISKTELGAKDQAKHIPFDECTKMLGMYWTPASDEFTYRITRRPNEKGRTKREILSTISRLYDPLGWLAPIIIRCKVLMQQIWLAGSEWDEEIPLKLMERWEAIYDEITDITKITIPRWIKTQSEGATYQLHAFSDASVEAYAACIYIRTLNKVGNINTHLVAAKTKVAPVKSISLPRLELCGAHLAARLMKKAKDAIDITITEIYGWTDSTIVLAWLKEYPCRWKTFIANRTGEIHNLGHMNWRHVTSNQNPADCATRGKSPIELKDHELWWHGPKWLTEPETTWPKQRQIITTEVERNSRMSSFVTTMNTETDSLLTKFSTFTKLTRVTAYILRFGSRRVRRQGNRGYLKAHELKQSEIVLIKLSQGIDFYSEIRNLQTQRPIAHSSKLNKLNPYVDDFGILRIGGRLQESNLQPDQRHPIILSGPNPLTRLVIEHAHKATMHGGIQLMANYLRQKYWIPNLRNCIKGQIHKCITCYRQRPKIESQLMGNLPYPRVQISRPLTHTGVDYCGPIQIKTSKLRNAKLVKGYVAIFICLTVKAIHIEAVSDMTTSAFLAALRRFMARRGLCTHLYSDCGSNFIGANSSMKRDERTLMNHINQELAEEFANQHITWHFNPPSAPHFGGLWEAGVKSIKYHLKRILGNASLTFEELNTTLTQIEGCLNSRPLTPMTNDPDDLKALTPGHFLIGDNILAPLQPDFTSTSEIRFNRWQLTQRLYQQFWNRWSTEYLSRLQERPKWLKKRDNVTIGSLVLLKEDNTPPNKWALARIEGVHPGKDGLVRVVAVRTQYAVKQRPITKICVLPMQTQEERN